MITSTPTRTRGAAGSLLQTARLMYLRWRLDHVERDIGVMRSNLDAWERDAQAKRVEIATLTR